MGDLDKSALTGYNGGTPIRKGLVDVKLDYLHRFLLQWLGVSTLISISSLVFDKAKGPILLLHENFLSACSKPSTRTYPSSPHAPSCQ